MAILDANTHMPKEGEIYFLDCNILMYMHYTNGSYDASLIGPYSTLMTRIVRSHAKLLMNDVLLSEFVNTYIQREFHRLASLNGWSHTKSYFKQTFKLSAEYSDILNELKYIIIRQIKPVFDFVDSGFSSFSGDIPFLFNNPQTFDFNDRYYGYEMNKVGAFIVTNDADFSDVQSCNIITTNRHLLAP